MRFFCCAVLVCGFLSISLARPIKKWKVLAGWPVSKNELDGDPVEAYGGIFALHNATIRARHAPLPTMHSELLDGRVRWRSLPAANRDGWVVAQLQADWSTLVRSMSSMEVLEWQGWAVGSFRAKAHAATFRFQCEGVRSFYIDRRTPAYTGDLFSSGRLTVVVQNVSKGKHYVFVPLKVAQQSQFRCTHTEITKTTSIAEASKDVRVFSPTKVLPDALDLGKDRAPVLMSRQVAFAACNVGNAWHSVRVNACAVDADVKLSDAAACNSSRRASTIAPGQLKSIAVNIDTTQLKMKGCRGLKIAVHVSVDGVEDASKNMLVPLQCRGAHESFIFTFLDHDGTISRAAAIAPLNGRSASPSAAQRSRLPVLLSLHGTGVEARTQADSYKYKPKAHAHDNAVPYTFGVRNAWVLAPTRQGAHNWEYTGQWSALAALEALPGVVNAANKAIAATGTGNAVNAVFLPRVDSSRVLYAGHSMGGHGAWLLAMNVPDKALGVAVAAGWLTKENYGASNRFFLHDVSCAHVEPALKALLETTIAENNAELLGSNLCGLPILVRTGARDMTVPSWYSKRMVRILGEDDAARDQNNDDVTGRVLFNEVVDKEHWWWDTSTANDGGVLNDSVMRAFYKHVIGDGTRRQPAMTATDFSLITYNPASSHGRGGIRVLQQRHTRRRSRVHVSFTAPTTEISAAILHMRTENVMRLEIKPGESPSALQLNGVAIVDGDGPFQAKKAALHLCRITEGAQFHTWAPCAMSQSLSLMDFERTERGPASYGPLRQIAGAKFRIVFGNDGNGLDVGHCPNALAAALYLANTHFIAADTDVTVEHDANAIVGLEQRELQHDDNIILIGGPDRNALTHLIVANNTQAFPPVHFENTALCMANESALAAFTVGPHRFNAPGVGLIFLASVWNERASRPRLLMIIAGTDDDGVAAAMKLAEPTIPPMMRAPFSNQLPDYVVVNSDVFGKGAGSILLAGSWDSHWQYDPLSAYDHGANE